MILKQRTPQVNDDLTFADVPWALQCNAFTRNFTSASSATLKLSLTLRLYA